MTKLRKAYLFEDSRGYHRLVKIQFRHQPCKDPPFSTWYRYTKKGDVYTFNDDNGSYPHWIPDAEKSLEDGITHDIHIVTRTTDAKPLRLKNIRQTLYGAERRAYEQKGGDPPVYLVLLVSADGSTERAYSVIESVHPEFRSILQALATEQKCSVVARRLITNLVGETTEEFRFEPQ